MISSCFFNLYQSLGTRYIPRLFAHCLRSDLEELAEGCASTKARGGAFSGVPDI